MLCFFFSFLSSRPFPFAPLSSTLVFSSSLCLYILSLPPLPLPLVSNLFLTFFLLSSHYIASPLLFSVPYPSSKNSFPFPSLFPSPLIPSPLLFFLLLSTTLLFPSPSSIQPTSNFHSLVFSHPLLLSLPLCFLTCS